MTSPPPPRRTVISPRSARARRVPVAQEVTAESRLGEVLLASLLRAQLRLAVRVALVVGVLLGGLPLLFAAVPALSGVRVFGLALPWLLLGVLAYPMLLLAGVVHLRGAGRIEREFRDVLDRS